MTVSEGSLGVSGVLCPPLTRYMKGTEERGFILGSVEEIVLTLDDNAMNLQSMSASRFVGPFMDRVQKWEKSLSHISEVVDVSAPHIRTHMMNHSLTASSPYPLLLLFLFS